jgi:hypothetical protein
MKNMNSIAAAIITAALATPAAAAEPTLGNIPAGRLHVQQWLELRP